MDNKSKFRPEHGVYHQYNFMIILLNKTVITSLYLTHNFFSFFSYSTSIFEFLFISLSLDCIQLIFLSLFSFICTWILYSELKVPHHFFDQKQFQAFSQFFPTGGIWWESSGMRHELLGILMFPYLESLVHNVYHTRNLTQIHCNSPDKALAPNTNTSGRS